MTDPDETQLGELAKKMLAMPPKKHEDIKLAKAMAKPSGDANPKKSGRSQTSILI